MRRSAVPIVAVLAAAALLGLLVYGVLSRRQDRTLDGAVASGERPAAPDRSLPLLDGSGRRSLADLRGHPVLVNFWASWCTPCRAEAPLLERAQHRLSRAGGTVLGVAFRDATSDARAFVRRYRLTYPTVRDVNGDLAHAYGTQALPESFLVDRTGHVTAISRGPVDAGFLDRALRRVGA